MIRTKVLGMDVLRAEINACVGDLLAAEEPSAMAAGGVIAEKWKGLVPVLDGNYRDALTVGWLPKYGAAVGVVWLGHLPREDQPVMYIKRLEFGDSEITAKPSARPALKAAKAAALEAGAEPLRSVIRGRRARKRVPKA